MTLYEAQKIGSIVEEADGGCCVCVGHLVNLLQKEFPEFAWTHNGYHAENPLTVTVEQV